MDDLLDRYASLVAAYEAARRGAADLDRLAADAAALAAAADSTWLRVQAGALAATARAVAGGETDLEAIVDARLAPIDEAAIARLEELLPPDGPLVDRLAQHDAGSRLPVAALPSAAERLLNLLRERAEEDLDLPSEHRLELEVERSGAAWRARLEPGPSRPRLVINARAGWTVDRLVRAISSLGYPGRHLARLMRPPSPEWCPSPETTVESGLAAVGREILLADHELAHELDRIGRAAGIAWNGDRIVAVRRALDDLAPAYAVAALGAEGGGRDDRLAALGADRRTAEALHDPLARATKVAHAAGPPLVRSWLVPTGQTTGLQRLLSERLVPTMLRAEMLDAVS